MTQQTASIARLITETYTDWRSVVKVDNVVQASTTYSIDFVNGTITFNSALTGSEVVKCSYSHINGVTDASEFIINPPSGKKYVLEHVETQFSKNKLLFH